MPVPSERVLESAPQLPCSAEYEAGPNGSGFKRAADAVGIEMQVVAPGKRPRAAADRVKTDRKDAELLARLLLAGQLTAVYVPDGSLESVRHLSRRREQVRGDVMRARHRVSKLLVVHGRVQDDGRVVGKTPRRAQLFRLRLELGVLTLRRVSG